MDKEQQEIYEYARKRLRQKKRLYFHFVLFFVGSIFLFIINKWIGVNKEANWYIWLVNVVVFYFCIAFYQSIHYR